MTLRTYQLEHKREISEQKLGMDIDNGKTLSNSSVAAVSLCIHKHLLK